MPHYFFHVSDGSDYPDPHGTILPDLDAARAHALAYFGDLIRDAPCEFWNGDQWTMNVADHRGLVLFSLYFVGLDAPVLADKQQSIPRG